MKTESDAAWWPLGFRADETIPKVARVTLDRRDIEVVEWGNGTYSLHEGGAPPVRFESLLELRCSLMAIGGCAEPA